MFAVNEREKKRKRKKTELFLFLPVSERQCTVKNAAFTHRKMLGQPVSVPPDHDESPSVSNILALFYLAKNSLRRYNKQR